MMSFDGATAGWFASPAAEHRRVTARVAPAAEPGLANPAPISEGAVRGCSSLGVGSGVELVLPRIRRSPCETDSAAMKRRRKGTVE
jgi:hypothetical protein